MPQTPRSKKMYTNNDLMGSKPNNDSLRNKQRRIKSAARTITPMTEYNEFKN